MSEGGGAVGGAFGERLVRALRLDASLYEEVEHDPSALPQALGVVSLAAVATGLGNPTTFGVIAPVGGLISAYLGWLASAALIWVVGVRMLNHTSDYGELLRTLGFAASPQIVMVVGVVPVLGALAWPLVWLWVVAAYVVAVRQALDVSTGRALWVCVLAQALNWLVVISLARLLGG